MLQNSCKNHLTGKDLSINYLRLLKPDFLKRQSIKFEADATTTSIKRNHKHKSLFYKSKKIQSSPSKHKLFDFQLNPLETCKITPIDLTKNLTRIKSVDDTSFSAHTLLKKRRLSPISPGFKRRLCSKRTASLSEVYISESQKMYTSYYDDNNKSFSSNTSDASSISCGDFISDICVNRYSDLIFKLTQLKNYKADHKTNKQFNNLNSSVSIRKLPKNSNIFTDRNYILNSTNPIETKTLNDHASCKECLQNEQCNHYHNDRCHDLNYLHLLNENIINNCIDYSYESISNEKIVSTVTNIGHLNKSNDLKTINCNDRHSPIYTIL